MNNFSIKRILANKEKNEDGLIFSIGNLNEDEQFLVIFKLAVWICKL
jgi:hypothetical protein